MAESVEPTVRRLLRSRTDRTCAGVCAGLAEYVEWDPTIVRLLWVLALFFSGGMALFAYIVLWIVMPEGPERSQAADYAAGSRLVRSRAERMLAGVCGGLAEYVGMDVTLMRVLWVVATFISGGLTLIAYPVFWLVMPESGRMSSAADQTLRNVADRVDPVVERIGGRVRESFNREPQPTDPAAAKRAQEQALENEILGISDEDLADEQEQETVAPKAKSNASPRWLLFLGVGLIAVGLAVLADNVDWLWFSPEAFVLLVIGALLLFYRTGDEPRKAWRTWLGGGLILLSLLTLADSLNLFWLPEEAVVALFMVGIGLALLVQRNRFVPRPRWRAWTGGAMVAIGGLIIFDTITPSFMSDFTWPLALMGFGALMLWQWSQRRTAS